MPSSKIYLIVLCHLGLLTSLNAEEWTYLLDKDLSQFETWVGVPHPTVEGLPPGTPTSPNFRKGKPMGLNNDVKKIFTSSEEDGEVVLNISGEIFGVISTLKSYENFHLSMLFKWGDKKWEPRLDLLRDSGVLYHCHGRHGAQDKAWTASLECQVQETDLGDFYGLARTYAETRANPVEGEKKWRYDPESDTYSSENTIAYPEVDKPHGEWNLIEVYTIGTRSIHIVNGTVVMVLENAKKRDGTPLTKGRIQIQSEGAVCYYKEVKLRPISAFPAEITENIRWREQ